MTVLDRRFLEIFFASLPLLLRHAPVCILVAAIIVLTVILRYNDAMLLAVDGLFHEIRVLCQGYQVVHGTNREGLLIWDSREDQARLVVSLPLHLPGLLFRDVNVKDIAAILHVVGVGNIVEVLVWHSYDLPDLGLLKLLPLFQLLSLVLLPLCVAPALVLVAVGDLCSAAVVAARRATLIAASLMVVEILHDSHGRAAVMLRALFTVKEIEARLLRHHLHVAEAFHARMLEPDPG